MIWGILCDFWEVADNLIITESSCGLTDDYYQDVLLQALAMRAKQRGQQVTFGALAQRLLYGRGSFPAWLDLQLIIDFCGELQHQPVRLFEWYVIPPPALYRDEKLIQCLQLGIRTSIRYLIFLQVGISGQDILLPDAVTCQITSQIVAVVIVDALAQRLLEYKPDELNLILAALPEALRKRQANYRWMQRWSEEQPGERCSLKLHELLNIRLYIRNMILVDTCPYLPPPNFPPKWLW